VVGDGQRLIAQLGGAPDQFLRQRGAVEKGEGGVEMEFGVVGG
jgi:hypothetical protein